jgi:hypothetical protein
MKLDADALASIPRDEIKSMFLAEFKRTARLAGPSAA